MGNAHEPEDPMATDAVLEEPSDSGADRSEPSQRPWQRRRYQVAAAVGVVAVLGTGLFVIERLGHSRVEVVSGARAVPNGTPGAVTTSAPGTPAGSAAPRSVGAPAPASGTGILPAQPAAPTRVAVSPTVTNSGSLPKDHHTLRIVSALGDLSGARELAWAADTGHPVGTARCTQNFHFNPGSAVGERPTMLLCWRVSATKSVYTVAVDIDHRPSERDSVASIDKVWSKLR